MGHNESNTIPLALYKKLISVVLREQHPATFADLVEDVKCRCARLRLPYGHGQIDDAIAGMGYRVADALQPVPDAQRRVEVKEANRGLTRVESRAAMRQVLACAGTVQAGMRVMPPAAPSLPRDVVQRLQLLKDAIETAAARVADLEDHPPKETR